MKEQMLKSMPSKAHNSRNGLDTLRTLAPVLVLAFGLTLSVQSSAALKSAKQTAAAAAQDPKQSFNPHPDSRDLILPMPGNMQMVLRAVAVPAASALYDKSFQMGVNDVDAERSIYERRFEAHVAAPFKQDNLPAAWRKALPADEKTGYFYYFIGKYEISNAQWSAVMGTPLAEGERPDEPKANISWYDLQKFFEKYNEWLFSNHADALPAIDGVPGYLRLPSETEWEFAARGGNLPPEKLDFDDFPLAEGTHVEDYAVFGSGFTKPAAIGSKLPNPLGLYDVAGNVAEMVSSAFRFTITSRSGGQNVRRLHGSEGGFLSKGGSFLASSEREVYPGRRVELKMFSKSGSGTYEPFSSRSVGARVLVSSLNVSSMQRSQSLVAEAKKLSNTAGPNAPGTAGKSPAASAQGPAQAAALTAGQDAAVSLDPSGSPLSEIDKVIAAASSETMKKNLGQLRGILEEYNAALEREQDANIMQTLRTAAYDASALRNYAFRCWYMADILKGASAKTRQAPEVRAKERELVDLVVAATNVYRTRIRDLAQYSPELLGQKFTQIKKEYGGKSRLDANMRSNIEAAQRHIDTARAQGVEKLSQAKIWTDIIPSEIRTALVQMQKSLAQ